MCYYMKTYFAPIKGSNGRGNKITIPSTVKLDKLYEFSQDENGRIIYTPVVKNESTIT